jgi:hypothetical protein
LHYAQPEISVQRPIAASLLLCCALLVGSAGCTSRTLPLPPPEVGSVSGPSSGRVTVSGFALEGASVGIVNDRTLQGTIVTSPSERCEQTCPFSATIEAHAGDNLRVWQFFETAGAIEAAVPAK